MGRRLERKRGHAGRALFPLILAALAGSEATAGPEGLSTGGGHGSSFGLFFAGSDMAGMGGSPAPSPSAPTRPTRASR